MADFYVKKGSDGVARLWLSCSVSGGNVHVQAVHPHSGTTYLYEDPECTEPYDSDPAISSDDEFHTSQATLTVVFDPTSSGGWTFTGRYKSASGSGTSPFVAKAADEDPARFSVVATSGSSTEAFDPVIRFNNQIMAQSGV